jgi:hypothetical protein
LEEEKILREYFSKPDIHKDFETLKPLFDYFSSEKNRTTSKGFEEKILAKINEKKSGGKIFKLHWLNVAAAVLLLIATAGIIYQSMDDNKNRFAETTINSIEIKDTYDNPEDAKKAVEHALALISDHLNKGKTVAEKNIAKINTLNKVIHNN